MKHHPALRITLDVILFLLVVFGWWYAALPVAIIGVWVFPRYAEIVIAGFLYDALFNINRAPGIMGYIFTITTALILAALAYFKVVARNNS